MFTSLGSAFSPTNFRDVIGSLTGNQVFGKWSVVKSNTKTNIVKDFSWNTIKQAVLSTDTIATFDAFMSFHQSKENQITEYPIEGGGFVSAMKVIRPGEYEVVLVKNGMNFNYAMESFIDDINKYRDGIDLVDIVTPFKTYVGCNIYASAYDHFKDKYNGMLVVKLNIREIMSGKVEVTGKPRASSSASVKNTGTASMTPIEKANLTANSI